ncbi:hypothetical protein D3C87_1816090 [compost metagenome]
MEPLFHLVEARKVEMVTVGSDEPVFDDLQVFRRIDHEALPLCRRLLRGYPIYRPAVRMKQIRHPDSFLHLTVFWD